MLNSLNFGDKTWQTSLADGQFKMQAICEPGTGNVCCGTRHCNVTLTVTNIRALPVFFETSQCMIEKGAEFVAHCNGAAGRYRPDKLP